MKRFLMLVGVAVVAAAMYVAASPASQQAKGPTARQFKALKAQVATLSKKLKTVKSEADAAVGIIGLCYLTVSGNTASFNVLPVTQFGSNVSGFLYGTSSMTGGSAPRTALDVDNVSPQDYLQEVTPACVTGTTAMRRAAEHAAGSRLQRWVEHTR